MKKALVSMKIKQWVLAAILMTSGLGMLSSCQQLVEEQLQEVVCQWVADYAEEGVDPVTGLAFNRVVEVYEFSEKNAGYYESYLLNGDKLVNAEYVRGENGDFHYYVDGALDFRSTMKQRKLDVCLDVCIFLLERSRPWTVRYDDGLLDDGDHIFTPSTEAQREQILKWYESRHSTGLAEKIIGKWIYAERNGEPTPTNKKRVFTFVSSTKAFVSASSSTETAAGTKWIDHQEADVVISGNSVTLTMHTDEHTTVVDEFGITAIDDSEFTASLRVTVTVDGNVVRIFESNVCLTKVTADFSKAIIGLWEGHCTSEGSAFDDDQVHRWEYKNNGDFVYYVKNSAGEWVPGGNTLNEYFVDGNLLCTRWVDNGVEYREWWEIAIADSKMNWTALRQDSPDISPYTVTFEMTKVK